MSLSRRLRFEILRRDAHACRYCGGTAPDVALTVDHVVPIALGGDDTPSNLVTACADCNSGKSSSSPDAPIVEGVDDDALRWARAMERVTELQRAERAAINRRIEGFDLYWQGWFPEPLPERCDYFRDSGWRSSIERFLGAGLDGHDLIAIGDDVMRRDHVKNRSIWRYFCGACWNVIRQRQETARELIDSGEVE